MVTEGGQSGHLFHNVPSTSTGMLTVFVRRIFLREAFFSPGSLSELIDFLACVTSVTFSPTSRLTTLFRQESTTGIYINLNIR